MNTTSDIAALSYEDFQRLAPAAYAALLALGKAVDDSGLDKGLTELVKLRVSQINRCAFCTQLHLTVARRVGVDAVKLDLAAVWREVDIFSPRERAALAWAESVTAIATDPLPEDAYGRLGGLFSPAEAAHLAVTVAAINAWNRIAAALRFRPMLAPAAPAKS